MYKAAISLFIGAAAILSFFNFGSDKKSGQNGSNPNSEALPKEWKKFVPTTGKFTVYLPSMPKYAIDIVNVPNTDIKRWYEMYVSEEINGTVYLINLITYHPDFDISDVKDLLNNVVNEIVSSNLNNHMVEKKESTFKERPSLYFHITNQSIVVKGVAFLVGKTVYLLTYTATKENFEEKEFDQFTHSFELSKPPKEEGVDAHGV
ncbi:MAG: hypothetical protein ACHQUC_05210 [Chlamydiales bacterium]